MDKSKTIEIVLSSDNNYIQHLSATLTSIFENTLASENINITIIESGITQNNKEYLKQLVGLYSSNIRFVKIDPLLLENAVVNNHITIATYYRLFIPQFFEEDTKKVIYLDCDLLVRNDIAELWEFDISNYHLGAVRIYDFNHCNILEIPESFNYFNAGVLLVNLEKWRKDKITNKLLDFVNKYPERLLLHDQDALNGVLYDKWMELPIKWNVRAQIYECDYKKAGFKNERDFNQVKSNPSIVHFTTSSKPWHYLNVHPLKEEYFIYLNKSNFIYKKFPEKSALLNKKLILFGTGQKSFELSQSLNKYKMDVDYYVDNDIEKWDRLFSGKSIYSPLEFMKEDKNKLIILIASQFKEEIGNQLTQMGFIKKINYFNDIVEFHYCRE